MPLNYFLQLHPLSAGTAGGKDHTSLSSTGDQTRVCLLPSWQALDQLSHPQPPRVVYRRCDTVVYEDITPPGRAPDKARRESAEPPGRQRQGPFPSTPGSLPRGAGSNAEPTAASVSTSAIVLLHLQGYGDAQPHPLPGPSQPPLTFDVLHLTLGDRVEVDLHEGPQEVGVRHHALGGLPVKLLVAFHDKDALADGLHLLWGLCE